MYLLYADESGTSTDAKQKYFVLAGLCLFERQGFWVAQELDKIAARFDPADPTTVELHGNPMKTGKGIFKRFQKEERINAIVDSLKVFKNHIREIGFLQRPLIRQPSLLTIRSSIALNNSQVASTTILDGFTNPVIHSVESLYLTNRHTSPRSNRLRPTSEQLAIAGV